MRILLTNDDGIHAAGLDAAEQIARGLSDDVWVVAPELDQSGLSHSLSLNDPLRLRQVSERRFALRGTPSDCVIMAVRRICADKKPDLVLSGVNSGQNIADDVTYSGTIAGAIEGTLLGIPSIAVSQIGRGPYDFRIAAGFSEELVARVVAHPLPPDTLLNVNVPQFADGERPGGVALTRMGKRRYGDAVIEKVDPRGRKYYWIGGQELSFVDEEGTDFHAVSHGNISVTPIHLDLTNYASFDALRALIGSWC